MTGGKKTEGPVKVKLVGTERCDVPGVGVVKPGDVIELKDVVLVHGLPGWPGWWKNVTLKGKRAEGSGEK